MLTAALVADHDLATAINNADGDWNIVQWKPSLADVVFGGTGLITGVKTDLITEIWRSSLGEHPTGVDAKIAPWLKEIEGLKITKFGGTVGLLTAVPSVFADHAEGNSWKEAIAREGAATATGLVAGAVSGALIGSAVPIPFVGTLAGALIGGGTAYLASKGVDQIWK